MRILIDNKNYTKFERFNLTLSYNSIASVFSFIGLKHIIENPLGYKKCEIYDENDDLMVTGRIINPSYMDKADIKLTNYNGYSLPGILEDCHIPVDLYPLQSDNLSLNQIADKILNYFDIEYSYTDNVSAEMNKKYTKSIAGETQKIKNYLTQLAAQRGLIITHNTQGHIIFTRIDIKNMMPVFAFDGSGEVEMLLQLKGQQMHSQITVLRQASADNPDAGQYTINNPYIELFRPKIKTMNSGDIFDVEKAARIELSNELANIKLIIKTKKYIHPGQLIQAKNENLKINKMTDFFVESTQIAKDVNGTKYTLTCTLPDVYTNETPINIFKQ